MTNKLVTKVFYSLFCNISDNRLSLASSVGFLAGLFPLHGFRLITIVLLSIFFNLNIFALLIGLSLTVICPLLLYSISSGLDKLESIEAISFMSFSLSSENLNLLYLILVGLILTFVSYNLNKAVYSHVFSDLSLIGNSSIAGAIGTFVGFLAISKVNLIALLVLTIIFVAAFRLNILALSGGAFIGITIFFPLISMITFWRKNGFMAEDITIFLSGNQSLIEFISLIKNGQHSYIFVLLISILLAFIAYPIFKFLYSYKNVPYDTIKKSYVFEDLSGRRWVGVKRTFALIITSFLIITTLFCSTLVFSSPLLSSYASEDAAVSIPSKADSTVDKNNNQRVFGFYVNWDPKSKLSFEKNISSIDVLIPCWYQLNDNMSVTSDIDTAVSKMASKNGIKVIPLISNYNNNEWDQSLLHELLSSNSNRQNLINLLLSEVEKNNFAGINIDFENLGKDYRDHFTLFMSELYSKFDKNGLEVIVDVPPADSAYDYSELSKYCHSMVLMSYDEHGATSNPGPIASKKWFEDSVKNSDIPLDKLIVGLGTYGYDWNINTEETSSVTLSEVMNTAARSNAKFFWDNQYNNPYLTYMDGREEHSLWFCDSAVLYNQILFSRKSGINKFAVWRLGSEDSSLWGIIEDSDDMKKSRNELNTISNPFNSGYTLAGEIVSLVNSDSFGKRHLEFDADGYISSVVYDLNSTTMFGGSNSKTIALTFDDGPNARYTPQILDILKVSNTKATFFVTGKNAWQNPEIIKRIYNEGHEIGNHTYSHINIMKASDLKASFEINTTQKVIEMLTGHSSTLFRPPYFVNFTNHSKEELDLYNKVDDMGYTVVGSFIDPKDWRAGNYRSIVDNINDQLGQGNIVLLHDEGTRVENTVKALPVIIESLKSQGYSLVTVSTLLNRDRNDVMPPVRMSESATLKATGIILHLTSGFGKFVTYIFLFATSVGIIRFIFLVIFSRKQIRKYKKLVFDKNYNPMVSVVVAAYNEEKVICKTIDSILESDYENLEVIIVNDGSKDNTAKVVTEAFHGNRIVRLINKQNGGKSSAVNRGFMEANGEIVVVIDADTILATDAVSLMVRHFENEKVAAVSGNVKVGNKNNLLTIWQHIEYVTGLNLERRAFDELNCIPVVPGAIGAWRRDLVELLGYYKEDTLAEDADITLMFLRQGFKIVYEEGAKAYTEAPEDLIGFLKQRLRWSYGTLQCLWKHRSALFNFKHKRVGFITLPYMWLYQFLFQTVSPLTEVLFILGLLGNNPSASITIYVVFFTLDFLITLYAFSLEKESPKPLIWMVLQRIVYRQLMTYVVYKSLLSALKGVKVGWNKLNRKGNVETPASSHNKMNLKRLSA